MKAKSDQITSWNQTMETEVERLAAQIENLRQRLDEKENQLQEAEEEIREKNTRIKSLENQLAESEIELKNLADYRSRTQTDLEVKRQQVIRLRQEVVERDRRIADIAARERDKNLFMDKLRNLNVQIDFRLQQIHRSIPWKLLSPLRALQRLCTPKLKVEVVPLHELTVVGTGWEATGIDPHFLLVTDRAWHGLAGWAYLELTVESDSPLNAEFYFFDELRGFEPENALRCQLQGTGQHRIPVFIPFGCQAIRFDPHDNPIFFKLQSIRLQPLDNQPALEPEFLEQSMVYQALGFREGNVPGLVPRNQIERYAGRGFCWVSNGEDPWLIIKGMGNSLKQGWCRISLRIETNRTYGNARIYFDFGDGYAEKNSILLPFNNDETVSRFCYLPDMPKEIRLDPLDGSARFSVKKIEFQSWSEDAAYLEICRGMAEKCPEFLGQEPGAILASLRDLAKKEQQDLLVVLSNYYKTIYPEKWMKDSIRYTDWILDNEQKSEAWKKALEDMRSLPLQPCISILLPVYNAPEKYLRKALYSVVCQSYPKWELCIADDASTDTHIRPLLEKFAELDKRIKVAFRRENGHISAASNSALELATGEYVALLDHDDELAPDALFWVVEALNRNPSARLLYSDEDKIDEGGRRSDPHFKSGWNPDMLFSQNYISHLGVYQRELISMVGGFRLGVEGSQDHDLILRCLPYLGPEEIIHIPKVLYHWRINDGSTAKSAEQKKYTSEAGIKALRDYFQSQGVEDVTVSNGLVPNTYRVQYAIPEIRPLVSLLIPTRDCVDLLEACVRSIVDKTTYQNFEILIIDNGSVQPETVRFFETITAEDSRVKVIPFDHPFNFSAINNYGVKQAKGEVVGLINNDIEVISSEWLEEMLSQALRPEIGCVGAKLYYEDDTIQHAGVIVGVGGVAGHSHKYYPRINSGYFARLKIVQNLSAVTAACLLVRKEIYVEVGGLEEESLQVAFNDVDFCLKVREAGYRNLWTPYAELYHYESKSRGFDDTPEKEKRFAREVGYIKSKWGELLGNDPYYSPNLTLTREDFSLK